MTLRRAALIIALLVVAAFAVGQEDAVFALRLCAGGVLFLVPGYAWSHVLLPPRVAGVAERVLAALTLAIANMITITLLLYLSPRSLAPRSWGSAAALSGLLAILATVLRRDTKVRTSQRGRLPRLRARDAAVLALAGAVLTATAVLAFRPLSPPPGVTGYTELAMVPDGSQVKLSVTSFELEPTHYRVELVSDGSVIQAWDDVGLETSQSWVQEVDPVGASVEARLYRDDDRSVPYRRVRLFQDPGATRPA